jgi:RNA polymerase sigma-70 factor (ECF subfamily)
MSDPFSTLIRAWCDHGDESAARELMSLLHPRVAAVARRHCHRPEEWEDLEQETFLRVFAALPRYQAEGVPMEHWVSRIALNVCRKHWRTQSRRPLLRWADLSEGERLAFEAAESRGQPLEQIQSEEAHALMHRLLESLKAEDRLVLSLLYLEEKSPDEVAELLGMSRVLVRVRAFRGRKKLHAALRSLEQGKK